LTPEQAEERARQIADNAVRRLEEQRRLEEEGGRLLGLDQALLEDVDIASSEGRFVSGDELRAMVDWFVTRPDFGGKVESDADNPRLCWVRLNKEARAALASRLPSLGQPDRAVQNFRRWLDGNEARLCVTFEQQTAVERRDIPFITPVHPLSRLAVQALVKQAMSLAVVARSNDGRFAAGRYAFCSELWESIAIRPEVRLVSAAWHMDSGMSAPKFADNLLSVLREASDVTNSDRLSGSLGDHLPRLDDSLRQRRERVLAELRAENEALVHRKLASLEAYHRSRLNRIAAELALATDERIVRMKTSECDRVQRDFEQRRQDIESRRLADIVTQRIAVGIVEVNHGV
jgi:hypothetical protein